MNATVTDAAAREATNAMLATQAATATGRFAKTQTDLADAIAAGNALDEWLVANSVSAQTEHALWTEVEKVRKFVAGADLAAAAYIIGDEVQKELLGASAASRSTSVLSNALDDVRRDAKARWLRGMTVAWVMRNAPQPVAD